MGLKSLFFTDGDKDNSKEESKKAVKEELQFPSKTTESNETTLPSGSSQKNFMDDDDEMFGKSTPSSNVTPKNIDVNHVTNSNNPYLDEIIALYENGFNKLNKEGVDFYEFYQSIKAGGLDNVSTYPMAFNMCKAMNPSLTKESIVSDGEYYVESIEKAYDQYKASGESKLNQTNQEKDSEEASLKEEVNSIEAQIRELTNTLNIKKGELDSIGGKYKSKLESISLKLDANKIAKTKLISEINKVITNINNNI